MIFGDSEAEIYGFYAVSISKPQDGCHDIIGGGGSYQKCEPNIMSSLWKKFDTFCLEHPHPFAKLQKIMLRLC